MYNNLKMTFEQFEENISWKKKLFKVEEFKFKILLDRTIKIFYCF